MQQLQQSRNLAEGFLALVEDENCDVATMDQIISFLAQWIRTVRDKQQQAQLQSNFQILEALKAKEKTAYIKDSEEAEDLLTALE